MWLFGVGIGIICLAVILYCVHKIVEQKRDKEEMETNPYIMVSRRLSSLSSAKRWLKKLSDEKNSILEELNSCEKEEKERLQMRIKALDSSINEYDDFLNNRERDSWSVVLDTDVSNYKKWCQNEKFVSLMRKAEKLVDFTENAIDLYGQYKGLGRHGDKIAIWDREYNSKIVSIDDILYYQITVECSSTTIGKPSKLGTAVNEALWGTAAATASAMNKMNQNTYNSKSSNAIIYFDFNTGIGPIEVLYSSSVDRLTAMLPEKRGETVVVQK